MFFKEQIMFTILISLFIYTTTNKFIKFIYSKNTYIHKFLPQILVLMYKMLLNCLLTSFLFRKTFKEVPNGNHFRSIIMSYNVSITFLNPKILSSKSKCSIQGLGLKTRKSAWKPGILPKVLKYIFRKGQTIST